MYRSNIRLNELDNLQEKKNYFMIFNSKLIIIPLGSYALKGEYALYNILITSRTNPIIFQLQNFPDHLETYLIHITHIIILMRPNINNLNETNIFSASRQFNQ